MEYPILIVRTTRHRAFIQTPSLTAFFRSCSDPKFFCIDLSAGCGDVAGCDDIRVTTGGARTGIVSAGFEISNCPNFADVGHPLISVTFLTPTPANNTFSPVIRASTHVGQQAASFDRHRGLPELLRQALQE